MQVRYQDRLPRYECGHSRADHVATPLCGSVRADTVDAVAAGALLAAVAPDQVALALAAAGEVTDRHRRSVRAAELAAERARYAADRAERAFLACEPDHAATTAKLAAANDTITTLREQLTRAETALDRERAEQHKTVSLLHDLITSRPAAPAISGEQSPQPAADPADTAGRNGNSRRQAPPR